MRPAEERTLRTHDGVELFYRHWPADRADRTDPAGSAARRGALVLFHRGHEHSGRMAHLVDELDLPGFDVFAWDARGHGRSPGERGHSPSFATSVRDVEGFVRHLEAEHGFAQEEIGVIAQSVGAVLVAAWLHDYAPRVRCAVLASPAFKVKLYVPFARQGLALLRRLRGRFFVNSYVKARFLTHDPERIASFQDDPLIARPISVDVLLGLYEAAERVVADAAAITTPIQLLISGSDMVVHQKPQHEFFGRLSSPIKEKRVLDGFFHDTLGEAGREPVVAEVRRFVTERFEEEPERVDLRAAHHRGHTREEADRLGRRLHPLSPRSWYWGLTRLGLSVGGALSEGIRLGHRTGFDSGATLDYVYRNRPAGRGLPGRMVDRAYLESIGWRGIRVRKRHLEELLRDAIARLRAEGTPVHVLDVAAGHGRYVLDALEGTDGAGRPDSIVLRDFVEQNVEDGRALIEERGLEGVARFEQGDAFDAGSLAVLDPPPTLGIVSGLYELFPDNDLVARSLGGLAEAIPPGGYLVYTNQPWHPQLELIARALTSHRGGAWVMRRRTQREMDQLVDAAGFEKLEQRIDEHGIFTVSLARRR